jgi:hypothetical protein
MSLTRFLLYSNQFDVQGICATTSIWLQNQTRTDIIFNHLSEYAKIYDTLSVHQPDTEGSHEVTILFRGLYLTFDFFFTGPWPTADELLNKTFAGPALYGLEGVGEGQSSNGSVALREAVNASEEVTWVLLWGGGNVLAQAVWEVCFLLWEILFYV